MAHSASPLLFVLLLVLLLSSSSSSPSPSPSYTIYARQSTETATKFRSPVISGVNIDYLMNISIGTPPVNALVLLDTGSDLTWVQCSTCLDCYNDVGSMYKPWKSSTYTSLPCSADECPELPVWNCGNTRQQPGVCHYNYTYGDKSHTHGLLSSEIFHLGSLHKRLLFGCSMESQGNFDILSIGIVGLGGGPLSLMSQLAGSSRGFSYCLPTYGEQEAGSFYMGKVFDGPVVSPMVSCDNYGTFYCITLSKIEIGSNFSTSSKEISILFDSGTSFILLPNDILEQITSYVMQVVNMPVVKSYQQNGQLCFDTMTSGEILWEKLPHISFIFSGGRVSLPPRNTFQRISEGYLCLAMDRTEGFSDIPIFGSLAQQNYLVSYDIQERDIYFGPANCTLPLHGHEISYGVKFTTGICTLFYSTVLPLFVLVYSYCCCG